MPLQSFVRLYGPALLAPIVIGIGGGLLMVLALTQPAWVGDRIGPGLFAQGLSAGVIGLSLVWLGISLRAIDGSAALDESVEGLPRKQVPLSPGLALLSSVVAFIVLMPAAGLVLAAAATGVLAGFGAGDRRIAALALTGLVSALAALGVGLSLLPPTTPLWPWSPF